MELIVILVIVGIVFLYFYLDSPSVIGAQGEHRVSSALGRMLDEKKYIILDDLLLPTKQGTTQVDHVVLSQFGIFVIETKNMSGWIFGDEDQSRWTQTLHSRKFQFQNPLRQNYHHVRVIQELLGSMADQPENLVAFVGSAEPKTEMPWNVFWSAKSLAAYVSSRKDVKFKIAEVNQFARTLRSAASTGNKETRQEHIAHVREKVAQKQSDSSKCPRCGSEMIKRTNKKSGESFLGCSRFPNCRGSRQI